MLNLVSKSDFVGFRNIDFVETDATFDVYSEQAEELVLVDLFGQAMYDDMLTNPTEPKYVTLIDTYLKTMMRGFFYYYFTIDRESYSTTVGEFEAKAENAQRNKTSRNKKITDSWNAGLKQYNDCAKFVSDDLITYDLYAVTELRQPLNVWGINSGTTTATYPLAHSDWFIRGYR